MPTNITIEGIFDAPMMCLRIVIVVEAGEGGAAGVDSIDARNEARVVIVCVPVNLLMMEYGCDKCVRTETVFAYVA